jgi:hypothetical protein
MIALLSLLLLASDTSATAPAESAAPATAEKPKAERKICRREEATESRVAAKRVCLTAAEWQARSSGGDSRGLGDVNKQ